MVRAPLILTLALAISLAPLTAEAQPTAKVPRIGILWQTAPPPPVHPSMTALLQGLRELGYEDGTNVVIEYRYGANQADRLTELVAELVRLKVDVITTAGDLSTRAAQRATTTIPIVASVGFPVESGFVATLARPGGNITGVAVLADELASKRLELLKELLPRLRRVAALWDPVTHERQPRAAEAAARTLGLQVQILRAQSPGEFAEAFETTARARVEALSVLVSPMFAGNRKALVDLSARYRIPTMYYNREFVESGGLMGYGPSFGETFKLVAGAIDKILKGARPADLPVQQPTKFELIINLKTAKALGLTIPLSLLLRADQVIE